MENARGDAAILIDGQGCSNDMIGWGTASVRQMRTEQASGGFIAWFDVGGRGEAVDASGSRYVFSFGERLTARATAGDALTLTSELKLIGQGNTEFFHAA